MGTIHIISHTHWDREWYLTFQQFRLKLVHLVDNLLEILENDPDFKHFLLDGQTIILEDYLEMRPEQEPLLRKHIENGRIQIGPWHISPDLFLVSPEAHIRNLLEGERVARRFGAKMNVAYMPDLFGHFGQLPQVLVGMGLDAAVLWRGAEDQPAEFLWEAPDGTQILVAYLRDCYNNGASLPTGKPELFVTELKRATDSLLPFAAADDVLIMLGNDHMEPSAQTSAAIGVVQDALGETMVIHSTLEQYLQRVRPVIEQKALPVTRGELRSSKRSHLLPGVLSARIWIKQENQFSQTLLEQWAEPFAVFAARLAPAVGGRLSNTAPLLRQAWRLLMQNHPHDSICGCSLDQVHEEMKPRFAQVNQIGEELTRQSLGALAAVTNTKLIGGIAAVVVYNPSSHTRTDLVTTEVTLPEGVEEYEIFDENGRVIPHQSVGSGQLEILNVLLDRREIQVMLAAVRDGRVPGFTLQKITFERDGALMRVVATASETRPPNMVAFEAGMAEGRIHLADQTIDRFHVIAKRDALSEISFIAPDVPAHGWRTFGVRVVPAAPIEPPPPIRPWLKPFVLFGAQAAQTRLGRWLLERFTPEEGTRPPYRIENELFVVEAAQKDGVLTVTDKRTGMVYEGLNRFVDGGDAGDSYNYSPPKQDAFVVARMRKIQVHYYGVMSELEIELRLDLPVCLTAERNGRAAETVPMMVTSRVTLLDGVPRIGIETTVENEAEDHRLRVHFPAPFRAAVAQYDGHFEVVERPVDLPPFTDEWVEEPRPEVPQQGFVSISDNKIGLTVANRGLPEVEVLQNGDGRSEIALTLLRCVGWLSRDDLRTRKGPAGPSEYTPLAQMRGRWTFNYTVLPHVGDWRTVYQAAQGLQTDLRPVVAEIHTGTLPVRGQFVAHEPEAFVMTAVKEAESGEGWIVRGYNILDEQIVVTLRPVMGFETAVKVNLAEQTIGEPLNIVGDGAVSFTMRGYEIVTVLFV